MEVNNKGRELLASQLLLSGLLALAATWGFAAAVDAARDGLLILLFGGFWLGIHAFLGFVRLSTRLDREAQLPLLDAADYDNAVQEQIDRAQRDVVKHDD